MPGLQHSRPRRGAGPRVQRSVSVGGNQPATRAGYRKGFWNTTNTKMGSTVYLTWSAADTHQGGRMRLSRMLTLAALGVALSGCGLGFAPGSSHAGGNRAPCSGDDVLEVFNPLEQTVDIYTWTGQGPSQFVATAGRGQSTIALAGTAVDHQSVGFVARVGSEIAPDVKFTRRCEKRGE